MKTIFIKPKDVKRTWYVINAEGKTLGRVAAKVAYILRGKHRPYYTPHQEIGDFVVVINADKIKVTGNKQEGKLYYRYSGYPGGLRVEKYADVVAKKPTYPLERAIKGMLPKGPLGRKLFTNAKIYAGENHPHTAQQPEILEL